MAGEHPRFVSEGYLEECIRALREFVPALGIEVGPMERPEYERLVAAGCEGLVVYQETYDREVYARMHTAGPKRDFDWRLDCPERGGDAGFRRIGIGALFGLSEWRTRGGRGWRRIWSIFTGTSGRRPSRWRFRACALRRVDSSRTTLSRTAISCRRSARSALRFPEVGIVLSTREPAALRDALATVGVTMMSAGSHTEPGGYTGQGGDDLHLTVKGRRVERDAPASCDRAEGQFDIADERPPAEIADVLRAQGLDPVWKDWDSAILSEVAA